MNRGRYPHVEGRGSGLPCPGCGREDTGRHTKHVCRECWIKLDEAEIARERQKEEEAEFPIYRLPSNYYSYPTIWHSIASSHGSSSRDNDNIQVAFERVVLLMGKEALGDWRWDAATISLFTQERVSPPEQRSTYHSYGHGETRISMREEQALALENLYRLIMLNMNHAYNEGVLHGHRLLVRMGSGEMSLDEFTKQTTVRES